MESFCLCCKEVCKESKKHDLVENVSMRIQIMNMYSRDTKDKDNFIGNIREFIDKVCIDCWVDFKRFEYEWAYGQLQMERQQEYDYERYREEGM